MSLSSIIEMGKEFLIQGIFVAVLFIVLYLGSYFLIYRKWMKGTKKLSIGKMLLLFLFFVYLAVVFGAVFGSRGNFGQAHLNLWPFSSYREAWYSFSASAWRNLILNIFLFLPMGIFLPLLFRVCRKFWVTYLAGFAVSVMIETVQLIAHLGVVEFDDVLNNTVGTMIGFGLAAVVLGIVGIWKKEAAVYGKAGTVCLQIPLLLCILAFTMIFGIYAGQELGNLELMNYERENMSNISLSIECDLNEQRKREAVYQVRILTQPETLTLADEMFALLGTQVDSSETDIYDNTAVYRSMDNNYSLWVDYKGPNLWLIDFTAEEQTSTGLSYQEVADILNQYGVSLPREVEFSEENGEYRIVAAARKEDGLLWDGICNVEITPDRQIASMNHSLMPFEEYGEYEIISEKEAYELMAQGRFLRWYSKDIKEIALTGISLGYAMDSKGFYQPVYRLEVLYNGRNESIVEIPALQ